MDKFLSCKRTLDDNKASKSAQTSRVSKIKPRKYCLKFWFTATEVNEDERPLRVICSKILAADGMEPNKRYLETLQVDYVNKP
ncbi:hypothetical protein TNCV_2653961 [Trichonephila clavipes]|nr:hypothetical protein TNCV_2653961 [Trichonephila clavipes]